MSQGDASPATLIWIFYALETLFDTKPGENFRALRDRIGLLLDPGGGHREDLVRGLRTLYDLRSAFVHGGLEILHPIGPNPGDEKGDELYKRVADACEFGFTLIACSIQALINRGWIEAQFQEVVVGVPL